MIILANCCKISKNLPIFILVETWRNLTIVETLRATSLPTTETNKNIPILQTLERIDETTRMTKLAVNLTM